MDARLEFRTLGRFAVAWNGREIPAQAWGRRRATELLKALIGEPGLRSSADLLVERLWPGSSPVAGRTNLRVKLHEIRAILAAHVPAGIVLAGHPPIRFDGGVVAINGRYRPVVDALEFERAALGSLDADAAPRELARGCAAALQRWGGPYLPDDGDAATVALRERFARLHRALLLRAADAWRRLNDGEREIQLLEQAFDAYPYDEQVAGLLVAREASRAHRARVRELYRRHAKALDALTGLVPSERLRRLAGMSGPGPSVAAPARQAAPMVDRGEALSLVERSIERTLAARAPSLAIWGPQGVGKTRLLEEIERICLAHGLRVGRARCFRDPHGEHPALDAVTVLAQLLRSIEDDHDRERAVAGLTEAAEGGEAVEAIAAAFLRILDALIGDQPALLSIDDAHLAPASALACLHVALEKPGSRRILLVAAFRPPLPPTVRDMPAVQVLALDPLDRAACMQVVAQAFDVPPSPELAQALVDLWPGDLGIVTAAAQHARLAGYATRVGQRWELVPETQPASLIPEIARRMVAHRIAALDPVADEVLKAIAYAGARADVAVMAVMLDRDEADVRAAVDELVRAGLATRDDQRVDAPLAVRLISAASVSMRRQSLFIERLAEALTRASSGGA